ncbi:SixA phosphatase family protein [Anditalea andensis]|nr:histidine phosphatase family protein [Anditalea andensis]
MKKLLTILRHGEAQSLDSAPDDFSRPLSAKGRKDILRISNLIKSRNTSFDLLLKSPSKRTVETALLLLDHVSIPKVVIEDSIYESSMENLLQIIKTKSVGTSNALIIGHNPSITSLINYLTNDYHIHVQPGTMVRLEVYVGDWTHITQGSASVLEVIQ